MLSAIQMMLVFIFLRIILAMVPKHGAINGIQYLIMTKSGFSLTILLATLSQFKGLMELMTACISKFFGAGSVEYCELPGNSKEGYCNENE